MIRPSHFLVALLSVALYVWSSDAAAQRFERMIVFGDSSSDTGNVQVLSEGKLPPWPAYYEGRWSNGPVWVEYLAGRLRLPNPEANLKGGTNYAYAYAESGFELRSVTDGVEIAVPGMGLQIDEFLAQDRPGQDDLIVLFGGYNDLGPGGQGNVQVIVDNLTAHAQRLADAGARHFLLSDLIDTSANRAAFNVAWSQASQQLDRDLPARFYWYSTSGATFDLWNNRQSLGLSFDGQALDPVTGEVASHPDSYYCWDAPACHATTRVQERYGQDAYAVLAPFVGDYSRDGAVKARDMDLLSQAVRNSSHSRLYDLNTDDVVNDLDREFWVERIAGTILGDANLDRWVDMADFDVLKSTFGGPGGWGAGDFSGDGRVELSDFGLLKLNFGKSAVGNAAVPEPSGAALLLAGLVGLLAPRRGWASARLTAAALVALTFARSALAASPYYLGSYPVGRQTFELVDPDRNDRKLRLDVWYPAAASDAPLTQYPSGPSRVAHQGPPVAADGAHPLLVYSHGHGNSSTHNTVYPESLASHGFIVAAPNHTGNTEGDLSRGDLSTTDRPADVSFVIDTLLAPGTPAGDAFAGEIDPDKIGMTGYSFGGYTTFATAAGVSYRGTTVPADERVKAILPISRGSFYEQPFDLSKIEVPALVLAGKDDEFDLDSWARTDFGQIRSADKYLALVAGADHTDVGWSLCQQSPADKACFNDLELATIGQYGAAFFSRYLEGDTSFDSMLTVAYASEHFPKVEFWQQAIVDTNGDGRTTLVEFGRLKDNFGLTGRNAVFSRGDFNRDRRIDLADFGLLKLNLSGPSAAVPEPSSTRLALIACCLLLAVSLRRRWSLVVSDVRRRAGQHISRLAPSRLLTGAIATTLPLASALARSESARADPRPVSLIITDQDGYWTGGPSALYRYDSSTGGLRTLIEEAVPNGAPSAVAIDEHHGWLYWSMASSGSTQIVRRSRFDGSTVETLVPQWGNSHGLAVVPGSGDLFFSDRDPSGMIGLLPLYDSDLATIAIGDNPLALAFDDARGSLYWTEDARTIKRAALDPTSRKWNVETVLTDVNSNGITLDSAGGHIYWTDWLHHTINRADLDGSNRAVLNTTTFGQPLGIELFDGRLYWTERTFRQSGNDSSQGVVMTAGLDGSNATPLVVGLQNPVDVVVMFEPADFSGQDLSGRDFANQVLLQPVFTNARLAEAVVVGANLGDTTSHGFTSAQLYSTRSYKEQSLDGIGLWSNDLTGWDLSGQSLAGAVFTDSTLAKSNLAGSTLNGADFYHSNLTNANLTNANLTNANLTNANLENATLARADFTDAHIVGANLRGATWFGFTKEQLYSTASYKSHSLDGVDLGPRVVGYEQLVGSDLSGWNLSEQSLSGVQLELADLSHADLSRADLNYAFLSQAKLEGADLSESFLWGAGLQRASLADSNLRNAALDSAWLPLASLANANLEGATFADSDLRGADLRGALGFVPDNTAKTDNMIWPDGRIEGLARIDANQSLIVRNHLGDPAQSIPPVALRVQTVMDMTGASRIELLFDENPWHSTISFELGVPVLLADNRLWLKFTTQDAAIRQVGNSFRLFDWTGVSPVGGFRVTQEQVFVDPRGQSPFGIRVPYDWDLSRLYTTGEVTLLAAGSVIAGDATGDGQVDLSDFGILKIHLGGQGTRSEGDSDGDGQVTLADFGLLKQNFGKRAPGSGAATVPEPGCATLAWTAMFTLLFLRGRALRRAMLSIALMLCPAAASAQIYRWDNGELIPETDAVEPGQWGSYFADWNSDERNLHYADFSNLDLTGASFSDSWLDHARFRDANLTRANLYGATLEGADLKNADLTSTDLRYSALANANLSGAFVSGANLNGTTRRGFTKDQLYSTASYLAKDLRGIGLASNTLAGWDFFQQDLRQANFGHDHLPSPSDLTGANFTGALIAGAQFVNAGRTGGGLTQDQLYSTASYQDKNLTGIGLWGSDLTGWDFTGQNLSNASLSSSTLTSANLAGAVVTGANFGDTASRGFTQAQLASTQSYQDKNLTGIGLAGNDLTGWDFTGQNLSNAYLSSSKLTSANLAGAVVTGANFDGTTSRGFTRAQLASTQSYQDKNLTGIRLERNNLSGWDFSGQNLTSARLGGSNLRGANLSGADLRGVRWSGPGSAILSNAILPNGRIAGLELGPGEQLVIRDDDGVPDPPQPVWATPRPPIPVTVQDRMTMADGGTLELRFDADPWDSLIRFEPGIPVQLGGTLELAFAADADAAAQVGHSFLLFDWSGVAPTGAFTVASLYDWDTSRLHTTGELTLLAAAGVLAGDANGDGQVDVTDFGTLKNHFGAQGARSEGDANGDGKIDLADFGLLKLNFGKSTPGNPAAVPEPNGLALALAAAALGLVSRFIRRRGR